MGDRYSFGAWARRRRRQLDLTQAALAARIGVATVTVQKLEADERRPSRQVAALLADALQVPDAEREAFLAAARGDRTIDVLTDVGTADASTIPRLPAPLTALVGRAAETAELRGWLTGPARLVTLTGAGGSGKTRLATQVASELREAFPDGVWFVDLSPVNDPAEVVSAIAAALQVPESPSRSLRDGLLSWARDRQTLLVLDNFEQVVDVAPLVHELLSAGPALRALVTSRVALRVEGEREYPVGPLALPVSATREVIAGSPAVQLFVERAQAVVPSFRLSEANAGAVASICAALDGLPLAIELAAARVRVLPPAQLRDQIAASSLAVLGGGARTLPARQRTIRAAIDWSYRLLETDAQLLLMRLGVFVGGCDLAALQAVCAVGLGDPVGTLDTLVAHSLVRATDHGEAPRYTLLESVREYALERLRESGEAEAIVALHAEHFIQLAERAQLQLRGPDEVAWLDRLEHEHANMQVVLTRSLSATSLSLAQRTWGWRLVAALWMYWNVRGHIQLWRSWSIDRIAEVAEAPPLLRGQIALSAARYLGLYGDESDSTHLYHEALALFEVAGARWWRAHALSGWWTTGGRELDDYIDHVSVEQMALADQIGDSWLQAEGRIARGAAYTAADRFDEARLDLDHGLRLARAVGNPSQIGWGLLECGRHALTTADPHRARVFFSEYLAITRRLQAVLGMAVALWGLGSVAYYTADFETGRRVHRERLQYDSHLGHAPGVADGYHSLAEVELSAGDLEQAAVYAERSHAIAQEIQGVALVKSLWMQADIALHQDNLAHAEHLAADAQVLARQHSFTPGQLIALVCKCRAALRRGAPEQARAYLLEASTHDEIYHERLESPTFCELTAACLAANSRPGDAAYLWGAAEAMRERHGTPLFPVHRLLYEQRVAAARTLLPSQDWDRLWNEGRTLTWIAAVHQAVAYLQEAPGAVDG